MNKKYKYDAFISYRHRELDKEIASKLQKMLESYKPPKEICPEGFSGFHIFRDETELPTSSNLSSGIRDALENSNFLIVICSMATKESRWCLEEINYFKELHDGKCDKIITVLAEGVPSETFPDELCSELYQKTDDNGNVTYETRIIEPLAASVVSGSVSGSVKKLKSEFLRIVAPILNCGYDALYKRNEKRKTRRIITLATAAIVVLSAIMVYGFVMLSEANRQRSIAEQNRADAEKAKNEALVESSQSLTLLSESAYKDGNVRLATEYAVSALPSKDNPRPLVNRARRMLAKYIGAFEEKTFAESIQIPHDKPLKTINFAANGKTVVTTTDDMLSLFDADTGALLNSFKLQYDNSFFVEEAPIKKIAAEKVNGSVWHVDDIYGILGYEITQTPLSDEYEDIYLINDNTVTRIDALTGNVVWQKQIETVGEFSNYQIRFMVDFVVCFDYSYSNTFAEISIYKKEDLEEVTRLTLDQSVFDYNSHFSLGMYKWLYFDENIAILAYNQSLGDNCVTVFKIADSQLVEPEYLYTPDDTKEYHRSYLDTFYIDEKQIIMSMDISDSVVSSHSKIFCFDKNTLQLKWQNSLDNSGKTVKTGISGTQNGNYSDLVYVVAEHAVYTIEADSGTILQTNNVSGTITHAYMSLDGMVVALVNDGYEICVPLFNRTKEQLTSTSYVGKYTTQKFNSSHNIVACYLGKYAFANSGSSNVSIYSNKLNDTDHLRFENKDNISFTHLNPSGKLAILGVYVEGSKIRPYICDTFSAEGFFLEGIDDVLSAGFLDDSTVYMLTSDKKILIYDVDTKSKVKECSFEDSYIYASNLFVFENTLYVSKHPNVFRITRDKTEKIECTNTGFYEIYPINQSKVIAYSASFGNIVMFDFDKGDYLILEEENSQIENIEIVDAALYQENVYVFLEDKHVRIYDFNSGEFAEEYLLTTANPTSVCALSGSDCAVLASNGVMYKIDITTGQIKDSVELSSSGYNLKYYPDGRLCATDKTTSYSENGFIMDGDSFEILYDVPYLSDYSHISSTVATTRYNKFSIFPIYSTEELINKAKAFLE